MDWNLIIEWVAVVCNLAFVVLMIKENIWSWPFGIIGSGLLIFLFYDQKVYLEAGVYLVYVILGFYGWYMWRDKLKTTSDEETGIRTYAWQRHLLSIFLLALLSVGIGKWMTTYTDTRYGYVDAFSTVFQLFATYLEAQKVLSAWIYWTVLNVFAIWFYSRLDFEILSFVQMSIFSILSVVGYLSWRNRYLHLKHADVQSEANIETRP